MRGYMKDILAFSAIIKSQKERASPSLRLKDALAFSCELYTGREHLSRVFFSF